MTDCVHLWQQRRKTSEQNAFIAQAWRSVNHWWCLSACQNGTITHITSFHFNLTKTATSFFQGSVATLFRWSWKILSYFVANLSKTLHISFYQNRSSIVEVMIKKFWCVFYAPQCISAVASCFTATFDEFNYCLWGRKRKTSNWNVQSFFQIPSTLFNWRTLWQLVWYDLSRIVT